MCGTSELIAASADGGKTWQVKHHKEDGEILLTLRFIDQRTGYAFGSDGFLFWTRDGGETWAGNDAGLEGTTQLFFSDELHGIRVTRAGIQMTGDGGKTWTGIEAVKANPELERFSSSLPWRCLTAHTP